MNEQNVTQFPAAKSEPGEPKPINFTIRMATGDGAEIAAIMSFFPKDGESPNVMLDQIVDTLDRQRARSDVRNFDKEIAAHEAALEKGERELKALDDDQNAKIEALKKSIVDNQAEYDRKFNELKGSKESEGRAFDPDRPGIAKELSPFVRKIHDAQEEIKKLEQERDTGTKNHRANMAMFEDKLVKLRAERDARAAII